MEPAARPQKGSQPCKVFDRMVKVLDDVIEPDEVDGTLWEFVPKPVVDEMRFMAGGVDLFDHERKEVCADGLPAPCLGGVEKAFGAAAEIEKRRARTRRGVDTIDQSASGIGESRLEGTVDRLGDHRRHAKGARSLTRFAAPMRLVGPVIGGIVAGDVGFDRSLRLLTNPAGFAAGVFEALVVRDQQPFAAAAKAPVARGPADGARINRFDAGPSAL